MKKAGLLAILCVFAMNANAQEFEQESKKHIGITLTPMFTMGNYKTSAFAGTSVYNYTTRKYETVGAVPANEMKYDTNFAGRFEFYVRDDGGFKLGLFYEYVPFSGTNSAKIKVTDTRAIGGMSLTFEF